MRKFFPHTPKRNSVGSEGHPNQGHAELCVRAFRLAAQARVCIATPIIDERRSNVRLYSWKLRIHAPKSIIKMNASTKIVVPVLATSGLSLLFTEVNVIRNTIRYSTSLLYLDEEIVELESRSSRLCGRYVTFVGLFLDPFQ